MVYVFITAGPITNLFGWGEGDSGGHVLQETMSRGRCGVVCPSRTSERGGEGDCVKEGGGEEGERGMVPQTSSPPREWEYNSFPNVNEGGKEYSNDLNNHHSLYLNDLLYQTTSVSTTSIISSSFMVECWRGGLWSEVVHANFSFFPTRRIIQGRDSRSLMER
jgi:hypothetical protein